MHIEAFDADKHLLNMCGLINRHLGRNHHEPLIDPWVIERKTLCAMEGGQFLAAAHLLRYVRS